MNELPNNPPAFSGEPHEKIESLRSQMNLLFGALLVASFTLTAFLGLQARRASLDLVSLDLKARAEASARTIQQDNAMVSNTLGQLIEFGRTHPDFQKVVLAKYLGTNAPSAAPVAAPTPPAKK